MAQNRQADSVVRFLETLRDVRFIQRVSFAPPHDDGGRIEGLLAVRTKQGTYRLAVALKLSYLDRASTHAILAFAATLRREGRPLMVFARYIPRPTGERLAAGGVNFVDLAGNMHLALGSEYSRTLLGRTEPQRHEAQPPTTAAQLQLMFLFASNPESVALPVRAIATKAGVGKSRAAKVRQEWIEKYHVKPPYANGQAWPRREMEPLLVSGYSEILRPKLLLGRFRSPEPKPEDFVARLPGDLGPIGIRFSLTGGPAAALLRHFYRGPETPIFLAEWTREIQRRLRLLPDRNGPVIVLRGFGEPVFWREIDHLTVAHPWLVYAELMNSEDPRAHEAAEDLRREFLPS